MYIPNEIKDLIHKFVLAMEHPVVKGLKDEHRKYWADWYDKFGAYDDEMMLVHLRYRKTISFYYGLDGRDLGSNYGYHVNLPKSKVTGPYCHQCGSPIEVEDAYSYSRLLKHNLCSCTFQLS